MAARIPMPRRESIRTEIGFCRPPRPCWSQPKRQTPPLDRRVASSLWIQTDKQPCERPDGGAGFTWRPTASRPDCVLRRGCLPLVSRQRPAGTLSLQCVSRFQRCPFPLTRFPLGSDPLSARRPSYGRTAVATRRAVGDAGARTNVQQPCPPPRRDSCKKQGARATFAGHRPRR
jgi:hypothetical protein